MTRNSEIARAVRRVLSGVALAGTAAGLPALSQAQDQDAPQDSGVTEVVITGSRIATDPNFVTSSPVTQIRADEIVYSGVTRVEDLINDLPQITPELTANESNGATGTATLDLRGLGSDRTLVLTNGHRMGFGDVFALAPDVNQVPTALVERVELLTGGASSTYGSDAVAGVVNFIMKDDFEGFQIDYQYSGYLHSNDNRAVQEQIAAAGFDQAPSSVSDGGTMSLNLLVGVNTGDGRGNITAYLGYRDINAITQATRDFSACTLDTENGRTCGGSATSAEGLFTDFGVGIGVYESADPNVDPYFFPGPGLYYTVEGNEFVPGVPYYNFGPLNYFQRPDERYTAGLFAKYEVNEHFEGYTEVQFMDDRSLAQIAPSGAFFVTGTINCRDRNPFFSDQQYQVICLDDRVPDVTADSEYYDDPTTPEDALADFRAARLAEGFTDADVDAMIAQSLGVQNCADNPACPLYIGRRNVEGGPRFDDLRHTSYRFLGGFRGDITDAWSYDVFANFSRLIYNEVYHNDMSTTRIQRALNVVPHPDTGEPVCQSVLDGTDLNCVPWNVFQEGGPTQEAINYLVLPLFSKASLTQDQIVGYVSGDLTSVGFKSPAAEEGIKVVFGAEYRDENFDFDPDQGFQSGDGAGQGGPTAAVEGRVNVKEFFTELRIPVAQDRPGLESLSVDLRYRYSDYSTGVSADTYNFGGEWTPVEGIKFRGGVSRAVRAANIRELFEPQNFGLWSGKDPCGPNPTLTVEQCQRTGLSPSQYAGAGLQNPAGQYNAVFGGNPDLDPEKSDSYTLGFVFTAGQWIPNLQFSIDYWSIEVEDAIAAVDPALIITQCGLTGDPTLCSLINRSPSNGNLWVGQAAVTSTNVNIGFIETAGFDIAAAYRWDIGNLGSLNFSYRGTILDKYDEQEIPGADVVDCAGKWGASCGRPRPEYKHTFVTTWRTPWNLTLVGGWRHVGGVDELSSDADAFNAGSENYLDLAATYSPQWGLGNTSFNIGITNALDNDPPVNGRFGNVAVYGNGNTIPGTWDALGRYYFVGVTHQF